MIIGVDIDEVLANLMDNLIACYNKSHNTEFRRYDFESMRFAETWGGTDEEARQEVKSFFNSAYFHRIRPISQSHEGITRLKELKHDLIIITSRPGFVQEETLNWLELNYPDAFLKFNFTSEWFKNNGSRKCDVCKMDGIELLIDDSLENGIECLEAGVKVLLPDCPWNQADNLPGGIKRVYSWEEIVREVESIKK